MPEIEIIGVPQSNYVWCCRIACAEKGVPHKLIEVRPFSPEAKATHPFGKIPALRHGDVTLYESKAICTYIDRNFDGPPLIPQSAYAGALCEQWISVVNTTIDPLLVRQYCFGYFFPDTPARSSNRAVIDAALPKMRAQFELLDQGVGKTGFLVGDSFTLADANLVPILFYLTKLPESKAMMDNSRHLNAYLNRHLERQSVKDTTPAWRRTYA
jgi:glutathione S-transferase